MIALYPIKPIYTDKILSGDKKYELRKRLPDVETKYILIYSTSPVGKVVGYAQIRAFHRRSVSGLWQLVSGLSGIDEKSYMEYFNNSDEACAIEFDCVYKFARPFSVKEIRSTMSVPQSFCYVSQQDFSRIRRRKSTSV